MQWDVFCRVIDHYGDIGVCWRLCADLASRGESVRLWVDDASALAWMAPGLASGVTIQTWTTPAADLTPGEVVIEAFGCALPSRFALRMKQADHPPVWINLEYLSAEPYVERCHRLPSPQLSGPGIGLRKSFFYPGFTRATGGLIREQGLIEAQCCFERDAWLLAHDIALRPGENLVSLFCYNNPAALALPALLAEAPTLLLLAPGAPDPPPTAHALRTQRMPYLSQTEYDQMLWCCDLNFVRGEDSFVRAQWAARPFIWQIYPQQDAAHSAKLDAFLNVFLRTTTQPLANLVRAIHAGWNGFAALPDQLPPLNSWKDHCLTWRQQLLTQADLGTQLLRFVSDTS